MKKPTQAHSESNVLAVLQRTGRVWRALAANIRGAKPAVLAVRDFTPDRIGRLDEWLDEHRVGEVMCVLPAGNVICRNTSLPDAAPEQLEQALGLQAEAHLLGIAPSHRLSMAVLPASMGETSRSGVILAWPESAAFEAPVTNRPVRYVPDVAALAALLNGQRPNDPLLWLDRADGSIALAVTHAGGAVFRATREETAQQQDWAKNVSRVLAETALNVGHTATFVETLAADVQRKAASLGGADAGLFIPNDVLAAAQSRVQGAQADEPWWQQYGVAVGALLARTGPLSRLTQLRKDAPIEQPSRVRLMLESMSRPRTAAAWVFAAVLVLMFGPLAIAGVRLTVLQWRFGDINQELPQAIAARQQLAMYQELQSRNVWPMTKLLSDLATSTPLGIDFVSVRVESGKEIQVSGEVTGRDGRTAGQVFALMQENLRQHRLFYDVVANMTQTDKMGGHKFDLTAKVARPYLSVNYPREWDFGAFTHAQRIYGQIAGATLVPEGTLASNTNNDTSSPIGTPVTTSNAPTGRRAGSASSSNNARQPDVASADQETVTGERNTRSIVSGRAADPDLALPGEGGGIAPEHRVIPPPITIEQINAMTDADEVMQLVKKYSAAQTWTSGPEKERLREEFRLLFARYKELRPRSTE